MKTTLLLIALLFTFTSNSQTLQLSNQYVFGGDQNDAVVDAVKINGNTIFGGYSYSGVSGNKTTSNYGGADLWVVSMNSNNSIDWQKGFGGDSEDYLIKVFELIDGNLLLASSSTSGLNGNKTVPSNGSEDFWLIKIDDQGNELWQKSYGGLGDEYLGDVIELSDGSILMAGSSNSSATGDKTDASKGLIDYWIVKIDANGNVLWDKTYGGAKNDLAESIALDDNGNVFISGKSESQISGDKTEDGYGSYDFWLVKLDSAGDFLWDQTLGGDGGETNSSIIVTENELYLLGSSLSGVSGTKTEASRGSFDFWVTKMDLNGNIIADKTYGGNGSEGLSDSKLLNTGELLIVGTSDSDVSGEVATSSHNNSQDFWVLLIDTTDLSIKSQFMYGGDGDESPPNFLEIENNSILLFGASESDVSGEKTIQSQGGYDFWILELSTDLSTDYFVKNETLKIFPNPTSNTFQISNLPLGESHEIFIYDMMGKTVLSTSISATKNSVDVNSLNPGMYTLQMFDGETRYSSKLIIK